MKTLVLETWLDDNIDAKITFEYSPGAEATQTQPADDGELALVDVALQDTETKLFLPLIIDPYDIFHPEILLRWEVEAWELVDQEDQDPRSDEPDEPGYDVDASGTFSDSPLDTLCNPLDPRN
jgi:hypothetical protein